MRHRGPPRPGRTAMAEPPWKQTHDALRNGVVAACASTAWCERDCWEWEWGHDEAASPTARPCTWTRSRETRRWRGPGQRSPGRRSPVQGRSSRRSARAFARRLETTTFGLWGSAGVSFAFPPTPPFLGSLSLGWLYEWPASAQSLGILPPANSAASKLQLQKEPEDGSNICSGNKGTST